MSSFQQGAQPFLLVSRGVARRLPRAARLLLGILRGLCAGLLILVILPDVVVVVLARARGIGTRRGAQPNAIGRRAAIARW